MEQKSYLLITGTSEDRDTWWSALGWDLPENNISLLRKVKSKTIGPNRLSDRYGPILQIEAERMASEVRDYVAPHCWVDHKHLRETRNTTGSSHAWSNEFKIDFVPTRQKTAAKEHSVTEHTRRTRRKTVTVRKHQRGGA